MDKEEILEKGQKWLLEEDKSISEGWELAAISVPFLAVNDTDVEKIVEEIMVVLREDASKGAYKR